MNFCERLKELRLSKNLTQKEVADACDVTATCICQLETGARNPTGSTVATLAIFFDVSTDYLLGLEDDFGARVHAGAVASMSDSYSSEERQLVEDYRSLKDSGKDLIKTTIKTLLTTAGGSGQKKNRIS